MVTVLGRPGWGASQVEKSSCLNWATQFLTVAYDAACSHNVSLRMAWISFGALPCRKTWWHLASQCCWNCTSHLTCFLSASVTRKDLQFGTWTAPSFQRHYRFRPTTSEVGQAKDLSALPSYFKPLHWIGADCPLHAWAGLHPMHISPLTYWTRGWVGGRTSPVALEREKKSVSTHPRNGMIPLLYGQ